MGLQIDSRLGNGIGLLRDNLRGGGAVGRLFAHSSNLDCLDFSVKVIRHIGKIKAVENVLGSGRRSQKHKRSAIGMPTLSQNPRKDGATPAGPPAEGWATCRAYVPPNTPSV